jgi:hypothetical protein
MKQALILPMRTHPKPHDLCAVYHTHSSIVERDTHGIDRFGDVHLLELQTRMVWMLLEPSIRFSRLPPYLLR